MKKSVSRLLSRAGESFSEVLVAILIVAMAALLLASMVSASGSIDRATREEDEAFYEAISEVEEGNAAPVPGTITVKPDGGSAINIDVDVYKDVDGMLSAYRVKG